MHAQWRHLLPKQHNSRTYPYFKFCFMFYCNKSAIYILNVTVTSSVKPFCKFPTTTITIWCMPMSNRFYFNLYMMTSSNGKIFCVTGLRAGNSPVNSPHKGQRRRALMIYLICAWINNWVNNREADDLRCHRAHYDITVMKLLRWLSNLLYQLKLTETLHSILMCLTVACTRNYDISVANMEVKWDLDGV